MDPNSPFSPPSGNSRRDFIKLAAASLGGTLLAGASVGCGGGGVGVFSGGGGGGFGGSLGVGVIPNGYTFYRIFTPGHDDFLTDVQSLIGGVLNNDTSILFYAKGSTGAVGVYQYNIVYNGAELPGRVDDGSILMAEGDSLGGSMSVEKIGSVALSNEGIYSTCAAVIKPSSSSSGDANLVGLPALWVNDGGGFDPMVQHLDRAPGGGFFGANMGDVAINEDGHILLAADFTYEAGTDLNVRSATAQGLFHLDGSGSDSGSLITQTGDQIQGSNDSVSRFGLCDFDRNGNYVVQHFSRNVAGNGPASVTAGIIGGTVGRRPFHLQGAHAQNPLGGNTLLGPRISNNNVTLVQHLDGTNTDHQLIYNGAVVASTRQPMANGKRVLGVGPGSVSNDLTHFLVAVEGGMELVVSNGKENKTILRYGDKLANSSAQIRGIIHGFHSDQADTQGRIVFVGEFEDSTQSIVVGIPH